jgi:hypothetical protein
VTVSVSVVIFHTPPDTGSGPLTRAVDDARRVLAERHRVGFLRAGADRVRVAEEPPGTASFGARLREMAHSGELGRGGCVLLGSGAMPLASASDRARFVAVAAEGGRVALANNRYSADAVAIGRAAVLRDVPDLPSDNALPRWLDEHAGFSVADLKARWRLGMDLDSPLDLVLLQGPGRRWLHSVPDRTAVASRLAQIASVLDDPRAELLIAGRVSAGTLAWLEREAKCRIRAFVEERGLKASTELAMRDRPRRVRAARSILGSVLDRDGPLGLGALLAQFGDAALIDTRVLLAHRLGSEEEGWPGREDRFVSDMLTPASIADPWLRVLTTSAVQASIPILLGGHSLVGPGVRLLRTAAQGGSS